MSCDLGRSAHSPTFPSLRLYHSSFSNPFIASPTSQLILWCDVGEAKEGLVNELWRRWSNKKGCRMSYDIGSSAHSPTFPSLRLCHSSFSNPSIDLLASQLILQPFHCFTYITAHSPTLLLLLLCYRLFTYVTWWAAHALYNLLFLSFPGFSNYITLLYLHIKINLKINTSVNTATDQLNWNFVWAVFLKFRIFSMKLWLVNMESAIVY